MRLILFHFREKSFSKVIRQASYTKALHDDAVIFLQDIGNDFGGHAGGQLPQKYIPIHLAVEGYFFWVDSLFDIV